MDVKTMAVRGENLTEIRCIRCNRLLFKGQVEWVEIKCPKCRYCQVITSTSHCFVPEKMADQYGEPPCSKQAAEDF